jgi:hypothetical protein
VTEKPLGEGVVANTERCLTGSAFDRAMAALVMQRRAMTLRAAARLEEGGGCGPPRLSLILTRRNPLVAQCHHSCATVESR